MVKTKLTKSPKKGEFKQLTRPSAVSKVQEELISFSFGKGIFYNSDMRFCRSISSLAVGAITSTGAHLEIIDAFCASGIRGIRYAKENAAIGKLTFVDIEPEAIKLAVKNSKTNKLKSLGVAQNISKAAFEVHGNFVEIDPFGTPAPYLVDAFRMLKGEKEAYISVTATDVAVLCGGKVSACMKNYQSRPLNSSITHEIGLRILLKRIADMAAEFNFGSKPLISFSNRHYLKTIIHLRHGAEPGYESQKQIGHVSLCKKCGWLQCDKFPTPKCPLCNEVTDYAGPLWLGELHDKQILHSMKSLNSQRNYSDKQKLEKFISLLAGEVSLPAFYYNIHDLCQLHKIQPVPQFDVLIKRLQVAGFSVSRTHFSPLSIKTNASLKELINRIRSD